MLANSDRVRIQQILSIIAKGNEVTLEERIYVNKYAKHNQDVFEWLRKASYLQRTERNLNSIDELLYGLNLCETDPHSIYNPAKDNLGDWFSGAPSWVRRS